jgi:hypothetical protein
MAMKEVEGSNYWRQEVRDMPQIASSRSIFESPSKMKMFGAAVRDIFF